MAGIPLFDTAKGIDAFVNIVIFDKINSWIINSIERRIENSQNKMQDQTTPGMIKFIVSLFTNGFRILILAITLSIVIIFNVIAYIISHYHVWIMLGAVGVFALCLFVIFYLWDIVRSLINGTVIPGINGIIKGIANFVNKIVRGIRKIGIRVNEMDNRGIEGEVPSLPGIAKAIATPLLEAILSPLRAGPDDYK
jgi:hypothetical protein